ncbi:MAG TPA: sigma-70 family RNA polymerase sigma factor [Chitinophagaceae bacterium]|nr:sigma-70 family RNA polymerase sigma factor [Chitinophagaceae bacterium]
MQEELSDTEIINMVLGGDSASFSVLVKRYQNFVFTLALRFTKHREDAEEVAQDIFVKTFRSLADFRGGSKFSTWLYTIVYTTSITFLRKKRMHTTSIDDEGTFIQLENQDGGFNANLIEQKSKIANLNEAINMLSPDDAQVITLFYKGEQSLDEISQILGVEINAVKVRLHRARQRLKEKLEKHLKHEIQSM